MKTDSETVITTMTLVSGTAVASTNWKVGLLIHKTAVSKLFQSSEWSRQKLQTWHTPLAIDGDGLTMFAIFNNSPWQQLASNCKQGGDSLLEPRHSSSGWHRDSRISYSLLENQKNSRDRATESRSERNIQLCTSSTIFFLLVLPVYPLSNGGIRHLLVPLDKAYEGTMHCWQTEYSREVPHLRKFTTTP